MAEEHATQEELDFNAFVERCKSAGLEKAEKEVKEITDLEAARKALQTDKFALLDIATMIITLLASIDAYTHAAKKAYYGAGFEDGANVVDTLFGKEPE